MFQLHTQYIVDDKGRPQAIQLPLNEFRHLIDLLEDLEDIGNKLKGAQDRYEEAIKKISTGRGNLIGKVESLKTLGAKASKQIDRKLMEEGGAGNEGSDT